MINNKINKELSKIDDENIIDVLGKIMTIIINEKYDLEIIKKESNILNHYPEFLLNKIYEQLKKEKLPIIGFKTRNSQINFGVDLTEVERPEEPDYEYKITIVRIKKL